MLKLQNNIEIYLCSWFGRLTNVNMAVFPKIFKRINTIPIKIIAAFWGVGVGVEIDKQILKYSWKYKDQE